MAFAEIKWDDLIGEISGLSTLIIVAAFALHVFMFFVLWIWAKRDLRAIATSLYDFTRRLKNQSLLEQRAHLSVQIEAFIADVNDVLDDPSRQEDRKTLLDRMRVLDEKRRYLNSMFFETVYNITRTMIEAYPLAGVLGTILAIGAALEVDAGNQAVSVSTIVGRFGEAIWSTFAGLTAAVILMFLNSMVETGFERLTESRRHVRETIARAKRELSFHTSTKPDGQAKADEESES
ncbi:MAG: MotA/TolQ/ExbB proton channel family protein [Planctomycetaceae bacterium]|nr:MotA/TolQ/ExbB proton channel family protein [Planctomycetaceae bacterium]